MSELKKIRFLATRSSGEVSGLLQLPPDAKRLLVLGHGAGAGMQHAFMQALAQNLADRGVATLRYQFPYMEQGKKAPNPPPILAKTVRSAVEEAAHLAPGLPLLAGGKSLGGRMTSTTASQEALPGVRGIVFVGFPLHAPGKVSSDRAAHLDAVTVPMLFLQGTRDKLADLDYLTPVCKSLGARATLHIIEDADHGFHVPKRTGRTDAEVIAELAETISGWSQALA